MNEIPLVDGTFRLERFPGKGGWTYAALPSVKPDDSNPFGWVQVRGFVDDFELNQYKLMPMGKGELFLPVRKEIRKKIGKECGDLVRVVLYADNTTFLVPKEIALCFEYEDDRVLVYWNTLKNWEQKAYVDWICLAKTENTKADRIARMMSKLSKGLKFHDKESA
ncbi:MAG: YdeI/OmpD-associated family protein [Vicingaceae bacterium]